MSRFGRQSGFRHALLACSVALLTASAAPAVVIDFENDVPGPKANGFASADSAFVKFTDSMGSDLEILSSPPQTDGQSLVVFGDDPSELIIDLQYLATSISLDFGNDDACCSVAGDTAVLTVFRGGVQVGQSTVVLNRNDAMDQTISVSGVTFDRATFYYNVTGAGLIEVVDNIDIDLSPCPNLNDLPPSTIIDGQKALLLLKKGPTPAKDKWVFKWLKGNLSTTPGDFGDPLSTATTALCLYDGVLTPIAIAQVPPDGALWSPTANGYKYKDKPGTGDGIQKIILKAGAAGKSKIIVKGKGANLPDPVLGGIIPPVLAFVVNSDNTNLFYMPLITTVSNTPTLFKGKTP